MSDTEGDIDSELLALVADEGREKKRKRKGSSGKSGKRRKPEMGSDSEDQPESEEEETNLYPLEGKYIDESDRQKLLQMSEIEREEILSQRLEELQRAQDKKNLDAMLREQSGKSMDPDSVAKAAKRTHALKGATKEKTRKLDELKARRKAKDEKKTRTKTNSPKRDRSSSPTDMEISDEEEEEGQFSKNDEQEEKERRLLNKVNPDDEPITMADLEKCRLTRTKTNKPLAIASTATSSS
jgi:RNA polymerase-associated protein RTF1